MVQYSKRQPFFLEKLPLPDEGSVRIDEQVHDLPRCEEHYSLGEATNHSESLSYIVKDPRNKTLL